MAYDAAQNQSIEQPQNDTPSEAERKQSRKERFWGLIASMTSGRSEEKNESDAVVSDTEPIPAEVEAEVMEFRKKGSREKRQLKERIRRSVQSFGIYADAGQAALRFNLVSIPGSSDNETQIPRLIKRQVQETDPDKLSQLPPETLEGIYQYRKVENTIALGKVFDLEKFESLEVAIDQEYPENALVEDNQLIGAVEHPLLSVKFSFKEYLTAVGKSAGVPESNIQRCLDSIKKDIGLLDMPVLICMPLDLSKEEWEVAKQDPRAFFAANTEAFQQQFSQAETVITDVLGWTSTLAMHRELDKRGIDNARRSLSQIPAEKWDKGRVFVGFATGEMDWDKNRSPELGGAGTLDVAVAVQTVSTLLGLYQQSPLLLDANDAAARPGDEAAYTILPSRDIMANGHSMGAGQALQGDVVFGQAIKESRKAKTQTLRGQKVEVPARVRSLSAVLRHPAVHPEGGSSHYWADIEAVLNSNESAGTKIAGVVAAFLTSGGADFFDSIAQEMGMKMKSIGGKKFYEIYKKRIEMVVTNVLTEQWFLRGAGRGDELYKLLSAHAEQFQKDVKRATWNAVGSAQEPEIERKSFESAVDDPEFPINEVIFTSAGDRMASATQLLNAFPDNRPMLIADGGHHHSWATQEQQLKLNMAEQFAKLPREVFRFANTDLLNEWYQQQRLDPPATVADFIANTMPKYGATIGNLCGLSRDVVRNYLAWRSPLHTQLQESALSVENAQVLTQFLSAVEQKTRKGVTASDAPIALTMLQGRDNLATLYPDLLAQVAPISFGRDTRDDAQALLRAQSIKGLAALETLIEFLEVNGRDIKYHMNVGATTSSTN